MSTLRQWWWRHQALLADIRDRRALRQLIANCLNVAADQLLCLDEQILSLSQQQQLDNTWNRWRAGEPLAYLDQTVSFAGLSLIIDQRALIPRWETAEMLNWVITQLPVGKVWEIGTGSGAIALALAAEHAGYDIDASDRSVDALTLAEENQRQLGLHGIRWHLADGLSTCSDQCCDIIIANPPYISRDDLCWQQEPGLAYEPLQALVTSNQGLSCLMDWSKQACRCLVKSGWLVLEHGACQSRWLYAWLYRLGYRQITTISDGRYPRFTVAQWK